MSLLRRRMMMASSIKEPDVPDTPTEELDYLTIIPLHEEEMWYYIYPYGGSDELITWSPVYTQQIPFYYRINRGEWVEVNLPDSDSLSWPVKLNKDTELQLKSMGCNFREIYLCDTQYFKIGGGGDYNVSGTPMSLLYGDGFKENNYVCSKMYYLFGYGVGLTKILNPKTFLPYTKLCDYCYDNMFRGCRNLTNAPELPAEILVSRCYNEMFYGCQKINYIKMLATDISADGCLYNWVSGISPTGTFVKHPDMTSLPTGDSGIPEGWTVVNDGEESEWAFSFNIEAEPGQVWIANAEQLVQINKMFAIITEFLGMEGGDFYYLNAPQEFDLRINGVRNFSFYYSSIKNENEVIDVYLNFSDGNNIWFGQNSFPWNNPVVDSFEIYGN